MKNKIMNTSLGFILGLEQTLDYLAKNNEYMAQIGEIDIRYVGTKKDVLNGKKQIFEIQRRVKE